MGNTCPKARGSPILVKEYGRGDSPFSLKTRTLSKLQDIRSSTPTLSVTSTPPPYSRSNPPQYNHHPSLPPPQYNRPSSYPPPQFSRPSSSSQRTDYISSSSEDDEDDSNQDIGDEEEYSVVNKKSRRQPQRPSTAFTSPEDISHKKWHIPTLRICLRCRGKMGNCCSSDQKKKKKTKKKKKSGKGSDFLSKQQITLYLPEQDRIESKTFGHNQIFTLREDELDVWWKVSTVDPGTGRQITGYASKYCFYPKASSREEDQYHWFLGDMTREECQELLLRKANPVGAFLVRFSENKEQFVLSVKGFNEKRDMWEVRHYNITTTQDNATGTTKFYLRERNTFSSISELVEFYTHTIPDICPFTLSSVCLIPTPISDPTFLRNWELESKADAWQIPRSELILGEELGHGYFGTVNKGIWRDQTEVAVKSLRDKRRADRPEIDYERIKEKFIMETEIMKRLNHPHVVKMFGVCIEKIPFYLVQELCENGDLLHHLRKFGFLKYPHDRSRDREKSVPRFYNLVEWGVQVAKGMHYLETKSLVHRDLAARNVLLDRGLQAKVADFGLTVDKEDEEDEQEKGFKTVIAVYWSAPEAIEKHEFSHKSDVWSFGVTLYEIITLADRPYNGMQKDKLKEKLREGGFCMDPPKNYFRTSRVTIDKIYNIMKDCWRYNPRGRPNFLQLTSRLETILAQLQHRRRQRRQGSGGTRRHRTTRRNTITAFSSFPGGKTSSGPKSSKSALSLDNNRDYEKTMTESTTVYDYEFNKYDK